MNKAGISQRKSAFLWLAMLAAVVTAANLWKPYHLDDTAHLLIAQWIAENPLRPMSGILNWIGVDEPIHRTNQPHLFFYLMAGWGRLFGWSEPAQHALLALFSIACIALTYRLARGLVPEHALWVTALVVLSPAFVVSQNMMVDVPLLACWLWFFAALMGPASRRSGIGPYLSAALAASCAVLIKYSSLALLPILAFVILWDRRWRALPVVLLPVAVLGAWSVFNLADYGGVHILQRGGGSSDLLRPAKFAIAWVLILGGVTPLGLAWAASHPRFRRIGVLAASLAATALAAVAALVALSLLSDEAADLFLWGLFAVNGSLGLAAVVAGALAVLPGLRTRIGDQGDTRDRLILLLWIAGGAGFYILLAPFSAVRHLLTVLPAIVLLACLGMRAGLGPRTKRAALAASALLSAGIATADFRFAWFYKTQAARIAADLQASGLAQDRTIWTSGHWGWQWYANQAGFRQIDYRTSRPQPGDLFIEAVGVDRQFPKDRLALEPLRSVVQSSSRASLFCTARPIRFYLSGSRYGPWSLSMDCRQRIDIYRVR
ncbi:ArnT family glycosyltransferase [Qipengyuania sediminis]|uniref:ArnT family glycosyltransferase n=1 Tax=Qipengyuania sediminis TaxID=1532023 RepID=UPI0014054B6C|nr:glycosyltransferase family 39 protein [Qipengyuania sediminis]